MTNIFSSRYLIRRGLFDFIKTELSNKHFGLVVDIGAGRAPYRHLINCDKYIGVDIEKRADVENLVMADMNKSLPLESDSVDVIIMTEVLEHLKNTTVAISEIHRVLKRDGLLVMTTPLMWPVHEPPNDFQRYTKYGLQLLLENGGFKSIRISGYGNYILSLIILTLFPLRKKIFIPLVFILNTLGLIFLNFRFGSSVFMISNRITAVK